MDSAVQKRKSAAESVHAGTACSMRPYLLKGHERPLTQLKCAATT